MAIRFVLSTAAVATLTACGAFSPDPTNSGFSTPSSNGTLSKLDDVTVQGKATSRATGNTYGYQVGTIDKKGIQGFAGIAPGARVTASSGSGTATMTGTFKLGLAGNITQSGNIVRGNGTQDTGQISLTADFGAGTLTGSGVGVNRPTNSLLNGNTLKVNGKINGDKLSGTATYKGVTGPLKGLVGTNEAIGVFHGHNDSQVHAGGFIAN